MQYSNCLHSIYTGLDITINLEMTYNIHEHATDCMQILHDFISGTWAPENFGTLRGPEINLPRIAKETQDPTDL
jgi:hypothetical protein